MTLLFDSFFTNIIQNLQPVLEKNDLRYATSLNINNVQDAVMKNSTLPYIQTFLKEVQQNWNQYHLLPKFTMINRTKKSQNRTWSFEFGNKKEGYRGLGFQQGNTFYVTALFSNHRDYDKAVMKL